MEEGITPDRDMETRRGECRGLCITDVIYVLTDLGFRGEGKLNTSKFLDIYEIFLEACALWLVVGILYFGVCLLQGDFVLINIKN